MKGRGEGFAREFDDKLRFQLKFLDYAPIVRFSALTGDRTGKLLEVVDRVAAARKRRVTTSRSIVSWSRDRGPQAVSKARRDVRICTACRRPSTAGVHAVHQRGV
jgi:predicted GTPase